MSHQDLSESARNALDLAYALGGYLLVGTTALGGHLRRTNAGTLRVLAARGLMELCQDGTAARLTESGKVLAATRSARGVRF